MVGALQVTDLTKRYGSTVALDGLGMQVRPGELFGFVGSNGAGKTTAMRIVLGVLAADSGSVTLGGAPVDPAVRRTIGYMPEERGLYPRMKVADQLVHFAMLHGMERPEAEAATTRWTHRLGVGERAGQEVQKLSLGNQQRVQLAAALVHDPAVLVLDEPFSGLDPLAVDVMSAVLRERADAGVPVVFSSHQLELVERLCDRVGIVQAGRMVAQGSIAELQAGTRPRWAITVGQAPEHVDWPAGAQVVSRQGDRFVLEPGPVDPQEILAAGLAAGPVEAFGPHLETLTELYRDVVTQDPAPARAAASTGTGRGMGSGRNVLRPGRRGGGR